MTGGEGWRVSAGAAVLLLTMQGCLGPPRSDASRWRTGVSRGQDAGFAWVPYGPAEPNGPTAWYRALEDGKCAGVTNAENDLLVQALAAVCRAAIEKKQAEWTVAEQLARREAMQPQRGTKAGDCLDTAGETLLAQALLWHSQHPNADPVVSLARPNQPVACEFKIMKTTPSEGPLGGGTQIEITGVGLNEVQSVSIGAATVKVDSARTEEQNGQTVDILKLTTPASATPGPVDVAVRNRAGTAIAPAAFTYQTGSSPQPTRREPPTAGPPAPGQPSGQPSVQRPGQPSVQPPVQPPVPTALPEPTEPTEPPPPTDLPDVPEDIQPS